MRKLIKAFLFLVPLCIILSTNYSYSRTIKIIMSNGGEKGFNTLKEKHEGEGWSEDATSTLECYNPGNQPAKFSIDPITLPSIKCMDVDWSDLKDYAEKQMEKGDSHGELQEYKIYCQKPFVRKVSWTSQDKFVKIIIEIKPVETDD